MGFGFASIFPVISPASLGLLTNKKNGSAFGCQRDGRLLNRCRSLRTSQMLVTEQKFQLFARRIRRIKSARLLDAIF